MKIQINVTEDSITNGVRCSGMHCPVANEMTRAFGSPVEVGTRGWFCRENGILKMLGGFPDIVSFWIREFDLGGPEVVKPISFEIETP